MKIDDALKAKLRNELIMSAKMKHNADYYTLTLVAGLGGQDIPFIEKYLEAITADDVASRHPVLWSIVIDPRTNSPSERFFLIMEKAFPELYRTKSRPELQAHLAQETFTFWSKRRRTGKKR